MSLLCEIAGVSRAAYYKWLKRTPSVKELENEAILQEIKAIYTKVEGIFGYRQMTLTINRKHKKKFNRKRIYRFSCVVERTRKAGIRFARFSVSLRSAPEQKRRNSA